MNVYCLVASVCSLCAVDVFPRGGAKVSADGKSVSISSRAWRSTQYSRTRPRSVGYERTHYSITMAPALSAGSHLNADGFDGKQLVVDCLKESDAG